MWLKEAELRNRIDLGSDHSVTLGKSLDSSGPLSPLLNGYDNKFLNIQQSSSHTLGVQ